MGHNWSRNVIINTTNRQWKQYNVLIIQYTDLKINTHHHSLNNESAILLITKIEIGIRMFFMSNVN